MWFTMNKCRSSKPLEQVYESPLGGCPLMASEDFLGQTPFHRPGGTGLPIKKARNNGPP